MNLNINPSIERSVFSQFIEIFLFIFVIFLELLTKLYEVPLYAYIIALVYSLYFFYRYVYLNNNFIEQSMYWEKIQGKIINKKLIWRQVILDHATGYVPNILYQYNFNNKLYKSRQFSLADRYIAERNKSKAQSFLNTIFENENIIVYVNPKNPEQSYIYQDVNIKGKFPLFGFIFIIPLPFFTLAYLLNI